MSSDKEVLGSFRKLHCLACGAEPPSDVHHIKTRGSGGTDADFNLMPLCRACHTEVHMIGWSKFLSKFPHIWKGYLEPLGWYQITHDNGKTIKLIHGKY